MQAERKRQRRAGAAPQKDKALKGATRGAPKGGAQPTGMAWGIRYYLYRLAQEPRATQEAAVQPLVLVAALLLLARPGPLIARVRINLPLRSLFGPGAHRTCVALFNSLGFRV